MARDDLLSLSADDLASLTNRGTVKRAEKELTSGDLQFEISEGSDGHLLVNWSDGINCEFQAGGSVHEARCSSGALGITRHIVRSVLAYQQFRRSSAAPATHAPGEGANAALESASRPPSEHDDSAKAMAETKVPSSKLSTAGVSVWDPGEITDEALISQYGKAAIQRARTRFNEGTLVELTRGNKPLAMFLDENCFVRFMVRGDLRYVAADCSEANLPRFVAMGVWAFRELPQERPTGLLSLQQSQPKVPVALLGQLQTLLDESYVHGIARSHQTLLARLTRLEEMLRQDSLVWPAELLNELTHEIELYAQHDARFDAQRAVFLVGELIARSRAIRRNVTAVPQLLIRGSRFDRPIEIASGRYVGLGMSVRTGRSQTIYNAFFQDADTGVLATVERSFSDETAKTFQELADTTLYRGVTLAGLAGSQVLLKAGKRLASGELILPRSASAFASNPQSFQWEQLKPPLLVENFEQLSSRWAFLPPSYLRPRRRTEGLHVVAIARASNVSFNPVEQCIEAKLFDHDGQSANLVLPFHSRGLSGFDNFLNELRTNSDAVKFVSGHVSLANQQLTFRPLAVVIEANGSRRAIYPYWSQARDADASKTTSAQKVAASNEERFSNLREPANPLKQYFSRLSHFNAELLLLGLQNNAAAIKQLADELIEVAKSLGFLRIATLLEQLRTELGRSQDDPHYQFSSAIKLSQQLSLIGRIEAM